MIDKQKNGSGRQTALSQTYLGIDTNSSITHVFRIATVSISTTNVLSGRPKDLRHRSVIWVFLIQGLFPIIHSRSNSWYFCRSNTFGVIYSVFEIGWNIVLAIVLGHILRQCRGLILEAIVPFDITEVTTVLDLILLTLGVVGFDPLGLSFRNTCKLTY